MFSYFCESFQQINEKKKKRMDIGNLLFIASKSESQIIAWG